MRSLSYLVVWLFVIPSASAVDFEKDVKPILERRCAKCHAYGKRQAGLSMETRESLLNGGENGKVVEFVDPELEALQKQIAEKLGYRLVDHRMELYGVRLERDN